MLMAKNIGNRSRPLSLSKVSFGFDRLSLWEEVNGYKHRHNETMTKTDFWRKTIWIWPAIFIAALLFSAVWTWIENDLTAGELWCVGVLTIILAVCQDCYPLL